MDQLFYIMLFLYVDIIYMTVPEHCAAAFVQAARLKVCLKGPSQSQVNSVTIILKS